VLRLLRCKISTCQVGGLCAATSKQTWWYTLPKSAPLDFGMQLMPAFFRVPVGRQGCNMVQCICVFVCMCVWFVCVCVFVCVHVCVCVCLRTHARKQAKNSVLHFFTACSTCLMPSCMTGNAHFLYTTPARAQPHIIT